MRSLLTLVFTLICVAIQSQTLVSYRLVNEYSEFLIEIATGEDVDNGVRLYEVIYTMEDFNGALDTVSGLVGVPLDEPGPFPLISYQHGTVSEADDVPSLEGSGTEEVIGYTAFGFVTTAPDYLGLGISADRFHPYLHPDSHAEAGVQLIFAAKEMLEDLELAATDDLFISGYSQGGHAAMAVHREIEENWSGTLEVTGSTPMSGPYDMSGTFTEQILMDEEYLNPGFVVFVVLALQEVYGDIYSDKTELFKPAIAAEIDSFLLDRIDVFELSAIINGILIVENGSSIPKFMFQDTFIMALETDPNHIFYDQIARFDVYDWVPQAPVRMYYCEADQTVSYLNSIVADSFMNANGAPDAMAVSIDPELNHGACAVPAILTSLEFFQSLLIPTSTNDVSDFELSIFPNPAIDRIFIKGNDVYETVNVYHISGGLKLSLPRTDHIDVGHLSPGTYILELVDNSRRMTKMIQIIR